MPDTSETLLQLRGLKCPLPVLRTRKALAQARSGSVIVVECTDPLAAIDVPNLIAQTGDYLDDQIRENDVLIFRIRKR